MSLKASESLESRENRILLAARMVREYYYPKRKKNLPDWVLVLAVQDILEMLPEASPEELFDLLINQSRIKSHMSRYLAASLVNKATTGNSQISKSGEASVFTGARKFSFAKISAMTAYITSNGQTICKAKLSKLLFYCDFVNYFLHGQSISGAKYLRDGNGPVLYQYDSILKTLRFSGVIEIRDESGNEENIIARNESIIGELSILETVTMYWVLMNFGPMNAAEISGYLDRESAHRYTRQGDHIPYEYARILQKLPARSMFKRYAVDRNRAV